MQQTELLTIKDAKSLREKRVLKVIVTYTDKTKKHFPLNYWVVYRTGIIDNLFVKGLCKIKFVKIRDRHLLWAFLNKKYRIRYFLV